MKHIKEKICVILKGAVKGGKSIPFKYLIHLLDF